MGPLPEAAPVEPYAPTSQPGRRMTLSTHEVAPQKGPERQQELRSCGPGQPAQMCGQPLGPDGASSLTFYPGLRPSAPLCVLGCLLGVRPSLIKFLFTGTAAAPSS